MGVVLIVLCSILTYVVVGFIFSIFASKHKEFFEISTDEDIGLMGALWPIAAPVSVFVFFIQSFDTSKFSNIKIGTSFVVTTTALLFFLGSLLTFAIRIL